MHSQANSARVAILGSGNVGANAAFFMAERGIRNVGIYDVKDGISTGKALDIMQVSPLRKYRGQVSGLRSLEEVRDAEIVVIAAGAVRKPGMDRDDLVGENGEMIAKLAEEVAALSPEATVVVVTEPVDLMTLAFRQSSSLPRQHVMGLGCCLDSARMRFSIAQELGVAVDTVTALVIGSHSEAMIPLPQCSWVSGVPIAEIMGTDTLRSIEATVKSAGDVILRLARVTSGYYAASAVLAELVEAIQFDLRRVLSVSVCLEGEYGLSGVAMSLPAVIGAGGITRVLTPELTDEQERLLRQTANRVRANGVRADRRGE